MRLLADENIPLASIDLLRAAGHDVVAVSGESPGAADLWVLEQARVEQRLLVTFDRDFGELVFVRGASGQPGVLYLRFVPRSPTETAEVLAPLLAQPTLVFEGSFTVVDREHVRQRALPTTSRPMDRLR